MSSAKIRILCAVMEAIFKKDIDMIEKVQKRATIGLMVNDRNVCYEDRLRMLGLTTLETRRLRGDLLVVLKIFKGLDNVTYTDFLHYLTLDLEVMNISLKNHVLI